MKRIYSFIALIAAVAMFTACGSDDASYNATPTLDIESADVLFEAEGGDGYITANTTSELTATTESNWVTLTVTGNVVTVTADPNITLDGRSAVIKLSAGGTETTVTATQKASIYGVQSLEYEIGDYEASLEIPVVHTMPVTVESNVDWITAVFNEETNQIELVAENNDEEDEREGTITVSMGDYSDEITITQIGFLLELEKELVNTKSNEAATVFVKVNHSRPIESVTCEDEWGTATFNASSNQIQCDVEANETGWRRNTTVSVTSGPVTRTLIVSQFDFADNIQGNYTLWYYSSGWASIPVTLTTTSATEGTLTWNAKYSSASEPFVIPITLDAETETFSIQNCQPLSATYTNTSGVTYNLMAMTMYTNGQSVYRNRSTDLATVGTLYEDDETGAIGFTFDMNDVVSHTSYAFYALRIGYTTGGYDGYVGAYVSYVYCELEKVVEE